MGKQRSNTSDSSPEEKAERQAQEAESQDANTAESSDADTGEDANTEESREDLLSVIQDVTASEESEDSTADSSTAEESESETESDDETGEEVEGEAGEESGETETETAESEDDAERDPPFHKHPRWQEMVQERDRYREEAQNYERITQFMDANSLTSQEVAEGFQTMALMKRDPVAAKQRLEQMLTGLQEFDPNYVPADLQKEVDDGLITPARAQEMAQYRAQTRQAQFQGQATQEQLRQQQARYQQEQAVRHQQQIVQAVDAWEQQVKSKDPEYEQKAPYVEDRLRALVQQQGQPQSEKDAVKLAEQAKADVEQRLKKLQPKKPPSKPMPSGGSSKVKSEPGSLNEAIQQAVGK